ncbi:hypothetical protein FBU59_001486 [Linderina macrospora]|uniref:Uncharacterized protein n=1 Tax=Linderina macrospora TaxID=4868 RepID=A0ACC1JDP8_9FUNG|nr:hypothetical protein FBU59_001486 [Linderina macrospora]
MKSFVSFGALFAAIAFGLPQFHYVTEPHQELSKRIIGGDVAPAGKYKFASVVTLDIGGRTHTCAGTIISKNFIVTAGHCLVSGDGLTVNSPQNITAGYGSNESANQTFLTAKKLFLHPNYNPAVFENDIGIIQVADIPLDGVTSGKVPVYKGLLETTQVVTAIGWGMTDYTNWDSVSPSLKEAVVKVGNLSTCKYQIETYLHSTFENSNGPRICIENALAPGNGPCAGDSGSPLVMFVNEMPYFAGVMSNGGGANGEATCAVTGGFAFYTHVKSYIPFIANVTGLSL